MFPIFVVLFMSFSSFFSVPSHMNSWMAFWFLLALSFSSLSVILFLPPQHYLAPGLVDIRPNTVFLILTFQPNYLQCGKFVPALWHLAPVSSLSAVLRSYNDIPRLLNKLSVCRFVSTGRERLIRSHSSARFSFKLSGNSN